MNLHAACRNFPDKRSGRKPSGKAGAVHTAIEFLIDAFFKEGTDQEGDSDIEGDRGNNDPCQCCRISKQHGNEDECENEIQSAEQSLSCQELADRFKLTHAGYRLAPQRASQSSLGRWRRCPSSTSIDCRVRKCIGPQILQYDVEEAVTMSPITSTVSVE